MTGVPAPRAGVPFPGSDDPELAADYDSLVGDVGVLPAGRDVVAVSGPDAVDYLQGQCSQDVAALAEGASADALLLNPQGKVDALVRITRAEPDVLYLDVDAGYGPAVAARLRRFKLRVRAEVEPQELRVVSLRGPRAAAAVDGAGPGAEGVMVLPYAWASVTGVDLLGPRPLVPAGVRPCRAGAWEALRIEAGVPAMGAELDERTIPAEAGLLERCVSSTKGCYTGQELVARLDARGNKVARRLRAVVIADGPGLPGGLGAGAEVWAGGRSVGRLTSAAWSPGAQAVVALAYLHRDVVPPCPVEVRGGGEGARGVPAQAQALPPAA